MSVRKLIMLLVAHFCLLTTSSVSAAMLVLYPKVPAPYSQIFSEIIEGIENQFNGDIVLRSIAKSESLDELVSWVDGQAPEMLIALGKRGYKIAKEVENDTPVVIGALPIKPNGISGISLLADPKILFDALQQLAPNIKRVHVVYSKNSEWLIQLADSQIISSGLDLNKVQVSDVKTAVEEYDRLLASIDFRTEAVWLPLDPVTANEQVILPTLLEKSWEQNVVLFSSKPAHAKRGALFSMFPDHRALGTQLANMVESMFNTKEKKGVLPLQDMKLAVNLRTAAHLGFDYKSRQKDQFHLTFPQ